MLDLISFFKIGYEREIFSVPYYSMTMNCSGLPYLTVTEKFNNYRLFLFSVSQIQNRLHFTFTLIFWSKFLQILTSWFGFCNPFIKPNWFSAAATIAEKEKNSNISFLSTKPVFVYLPSGLFMLDPWFEGFCPCGFIPKFCKLGISKLPRLLLPHAL